MDEKQDKIIEVAKKMLLNLKEEYNIIGERLDILNVTNFKDFIPENPIKPFDSNEMLVKNERRLVIIQVKSHMDKLEGQIEGQGELIYKLSKEGEAEEQGKLEMIRDNANFKAEILNLKQKLKENGIQEESDDKKEE